MWHGETGRTSFNTAASSIAIPLSYSSPSSPGSRPPLDRFGIAFLIGFQLEYVAYGSAILFGLFAFGMTWGTGIKSPLDASVFTDAAGALLLAAFLTAVRKAQQAEAEKPQA
jgi:hypothetical protein